MPTVLISGASTGIGRAIALCLARAGWNVLAGVRDPKDGENLYAQAGSAGAKGGLVPVTLDITDPGEIAQAAEVVSEHTGDAGLDALVNNAGVGASGPLELFPMEDFRRAFEVNLFGHVAVTQALLPALRQAKGRIVFMSSIGGRVAVPYSAPYGAPKHALETVGDALRVELHSSGIQVTLIEPGSVATPIWGKSRKAAESQAVPAALQDVYGHIPGAIDKILEATDRGGIPPERVAETVVRALGAKHMRSRYLVGSDARAMVLVRALLPDKVFDLVVRRRLGV